MKYTIGKYREYSGPVYFGKHKLAKPNKTDNLYDRLLYIATITESASYDSVNMYDRGIVSVGLFQVIERAPLFLASALLGKIEQACGLDLINKAFSPVFVADGSSFLSGRFADSENNIIDTVQEQQRYFLGGSDGITWSREQRERADLVCDCFVQLLSNPATFDVHRTWTRNKLKEYELSNCPKTDPRKHAVYISFAGNLPKLTNDLSGRILASNPNISYIDFAKELVRIGRIDVWRQRATKIIPLIEELF